MIEIRINMKKIAFILGTRPEIIKLYSSIIEAKNRNLDFFIIHTNQHYDEKMDKIFFEELEIPYPKYNLNIGSGRHAEQTARMMIGIEKILLEENPDIVLVQGDTNSVLAGALVASKLGISVGHIEAGLRSHDRSMPEEINRIVTDHISNLLFCPTVKQKNILLKEGIDINKLAVVGNTVVDSVYNAKKLSEIKSNILEKLDLITNSYFLLTCHRPSNTDNAENFSEIINGISKICEHEGIRCVFPAHPRLKNKLEMIRNNNNFIIIDPIGYLDMLQLQLNSKMIFTDSGGIQEESCILEKKCIILRTNTERPETLEVGGALLIDEVVSSEIINKYTLLKDKQISWSNPFGDGRASFYIFNSIDKA